LASEADQPHSPTKGRQDEAFRMAGRGGAGLGSRVRSLPGRVDGSTRSGTDAGTDAKAGFLVHDVSYRNVELHPDAAR